MRVLISIILLCFSGLSFAECVLTRGETTTDGGVGLGPSDGFVATRAPGIKAKGFIRSHLIVPRPDSLTCTAGSQLYLTMSNDKVLAGSSSLGGVYDIIDGKTAYYFDSAYAFTVEDAATGEEVPKYPNKKVITYDHDGTYTAPTIKVNVYATNDGENLSGNSVISFHYASFLQKTTAEPLTGNSGLITYYAHGVITEPPTTCRIQNGKNILQLNLPRVAHSSFPEKGFTQDSNGVAEDYFDIQCGASRASVYITTQYDNYENVELEFGTTSIFKSQNEGQNGNAKGIGVVISPNKNFIYGLAVDKPIHVVNVIGREQKITLYAKYYRYADDYTPGKISGSINFNLEVK